MLLFRPSSTVYAAPGSSFERFAARSLVLLTSFEPRLRASAPPRPMGGVRRSDSTNLLLEVFDRLEQAFFEADLGLPAEDRPRAGDVGAALFRIVDRQRAL